MMNNRYPYALLLASAIVLALIVSSSPCMAGAKQRLDRASDWPLVDLSAYDTVFVEDCRVTDPKAAERKIQDLLNTVPERMANYISYSIDREVYPTVERREPGAGEQGVVVRVELTQYKPGSATARFFLAGAGSAHLDITVHIVDAASGEELTSFSESRNFAYGGLYGGSRGISLMEQKAAREVGAWLSLAQGIDEKTVIKRMKEVEPLGGPDRPHGTIILMRPQGMVGAAGRFRIGVDETSVGESKRNTYHMVYVAPGDHTVWIGGDKKRHRVREFTVKAGETHYFMAMGMQPIPEKKGAKKLPECRLAWEIDLTEE